MIETVIAVTSTLVVLFGWLISRRLRKKVQSSTGEEQDEQKMQIILDLKRRGKPIPSWLAAEALQIQERQKQRERHHANDDFDEE